MNEVEFLREQVRSAWDWLELTVSDVTDEQANWWPAGGANSIGATYLHIVINPDVEINRLLYGRIPLVERDWQGDVGQGLAYDPDRFDDWPARGARVDWGRLRRYGQAVKAWLVGSLGELTRKDLGRPVDMTRAGLGIWEGRELYVLHGFRHVYMHGGEIACLKGLQGAKGYLGGFDAPADARPGYYVTIKNETDAPVVVFENGVQREALQPTSGIGYSFMLFGGTKTFTVKAPDGTVLASRSFTWRELKRGGGVNIVVGDEASPEPPG